MDAIWPAAPDSCRKIFYCSYKSIYSRYGEHAVLKTYIADMVSMLFFVVDFIN